MRTLVLDEVPMAVENGVYDTKIYKFYEYNETPKLLKAVCLQFI